MKTRGFGPMPYVLFGCLARTVGLRELVLGRSRRSLADNLLGDSGRPELVELAAPSEQRTAAAAPDQAADFVERERDECGREHDDDQRDVDVPGQIVEPNALAVLDDRDDHRRAADEPG